MSNAFGKNIDIDKSKRIHPRQIEENTSKTNQWDIQQRNYWSLKLMMSVGGLHQLRLYSGAVVFKRMAMLVIYQCWIEHTQIIEISSWDEV